MFDFLRNLTKSEAEKRQELLTAYLDEALTPQERTAFEEQLRSDSALQASLEQQRQIKQQISQLPRMRAPRNFTLDPALYGRPAPQPAFRLYPIMRTATALAAIMLIFLFSVELFTSVTGQAGTAANEPVASNGELAGVEDADRAFGTAEEEPAEEPAAAEESVEEAANEVVEAEFEEEAQEEAMEEETAEEEPAAPQEAPVAEEEMPPPAAVAGEAGGEDADASSTDEATTTLEEDGVVITKTAEPTIISDFAPAITTEQSVEANLYSDTVESQNQLPDVERPSEGIQLSTIQLLQIGLGILFVILLAATWLLRRQL